MEVRLLAATPKPLRVLWTAARTCYSNATPQALWDVYPGDKKAAQLLRGLWKKGHHSIFEHVSFSFAISGISRSCLAQLTRHRIGISFAVQSQRHVRLDRTSYVRPATVTNSPAVLGIFDRCVQIAFDTYEELRKLGVPLEDARFVLPQATSTNLVLTANLRELMWIYQLRVTEPGAQWEIRELVERLFNCVVQKVPALREVFGDD